MALSAVPQASVALVTGAGSGLGRAVAVSLAAQGASLVLFGRTLAPLEETARSLRGIGAQALPLQVDVARHEQVREAVARASAALGSIGVLVNSAGVVGPVGPMAQNDPEEWISSIAINLLGAVHCIHAVLPDMITRQAGRIVNISGGGAASMRPGFSAYAAAKTALVRMTETLGAEVAPYGIRVNAVAPGLLPTRMLSSAPGTQPAEGALGRAAELVTFLASEAAGQLTGKLISAVHDPWPEFGRRDAELNAGPLYTLRRIDPFTIAAALPGLSRNGS